MRHILLSITLYGFALFLDGAGYGFMSEDKALCEQRRAQIATDPRVTAISKSCVEMVAEELTKA